MPTTKGYFQDKLILVLLSVNIFVVALTGTVIGLRMTSISSESYFIQYRSGFGNVAYKTGGMYNLILFIVFALLVVGFNIIMSYKTYNLRKQLATVLLGMSALLVVIALTVSNALLALR